MKNLYLKFLILLLFAVIGGERALAINVTIDSISYKLDGTEAIVTGTTKTRLIIPATVTYNGLTYDVDSIGDKAFLNNKTLRFANTRKVKGMGSMSFAGCINIKKIELPEIVNIGCLAFTECTSLSSINFGNKLKYINTSYEYEGSSWNINGRYYDAGNGCFSNCPALQYLVFPKSFYGFLYGYSPCGGCKNLQVIIYCGHKLSQLGSSARVYGSNDFVKTDAYSFTYNGKKPTVSFTNNLPMGFAITNSDLNVLHADAGTYTDSIPFTFTNADMSFEAYVPYSYIINKVPLTATVQDVSRIYGDENPTVKATYVGFVNNENESVIDKKGTISTQATPKSDVGTYPITLSDISDNNYDITVESGTLTVTKAALTAIADDKTKNYGEDNPILSVTYIGLKNSETVPEWTTAPTLSTSAVKKSDAGSYPITFGGGVAKNYDVTYKNGTLTINKSKLVVSAKDATRKYYEKNPDLYFSLNGLVDGDDASSAFTTSPTITTTATLYSPAGNYPITIANGNSKNYTLSYVDGNLTVQKRTLNASVGNYSRYFGEANPEFTITYDGFVNDETEAVLIKKPTVSTTATKDSNVGSYGIIVSGGIAENYDFNYTNGTLTINKAYQTLSWDQDLSNLTQFDQIELTAEATSGLTIQYVLDNDDICSLSQIGDKTYLVCSKPGDALIYAVQSGDDNYYQTTKMFKPIHISPSTGIETFDADSKNYNVRYDGNKIIFDNIPERAEISIYTINGTLVYCGKEQSIPAQAGLYIIRVNNWVKKLDIKR